MIIMTVNATFNMPTSHISLYSHDTSGRHDGGQSQSAQSSVHRFVRGQKDPAKMTHAKMAFAERGLGTERAHKFRVSLMMMVRVCAWAEVQSGVCMRACKRAAQRTLSWPP